MIKKLGDWGLEIRGLRLAGRMESAATVRGRRSRSRLRI